MLYAFYNLQFFFFLDILGAALLCLPEFKTILIILVS